MTDRANIISGLLAAHAIVNSLTEEEGPSFLGGMLAALDVQILHIGFLLDESDKRSKADAAPLN